MKADNIIKMQFISKSCNEGFSRMAISAIAATVDPTLEELSELKTAVSEAVTNAIVHGYRDTLGMIYIVVRMYENRIVISIRDKGCGIEDIQKARTPLYTTGNREERSGMGFTIMESFCDKVTVYSNSSYGTKITLEKALTSKEKPCRS